MKLRDLVELAEREPELLDYTLNLSQYMRIPDDAKEVNDEADEGDGDFTVVVDFPIRAILSSEETQEIRFALYHSDFDAVQKSKDRLLKEVDEEDRT